MFQDRRWPVTWRVTMHFDVWALCFCDYGWWRLSACWPKMAMALQACIRNVDSRCWPRDLELRTDSYTVRFSHLLQRLYIRCVRGLLDRPVMLLLWDARPDISIMGSSGTSLAWSAVAHGVRRSGLLERIAGGGRSQETGWLSMSRKVGSRLFPSSDSRCLAMSARKWFRRLPW